MGVRPVRTVATLEQKGQVQDVLVVGAAIAKSQLKDERPRPRQEWLAFRVPYMAAAQRNALVTGLPSATAKKLLLIRQ